MSESCSQTGIMASNKDMTIRRAAGKDLEAVAVLFDKYRQFYRQPPDLDGAIKFIRLRLKLEDSVILVACTDLGQSVGFAQLYPVFSSVRMACGWILNDLYVDDQWRGRGAGEALMQGARKHCLQNGAAALWLSTEKDNAVAKRLYERLGYSLDETFDHYELNLQ